MLKKLSNYFFQGLIFLAPIGITAYIFYKAFVFIDGLLRLPYPGVGFIITIAGVTLLGFLTSNFLTRWIFQLLEKIMTRLPFIRLLHSSVKDVLTAFVGDRRRFDKPVVVEVIPGSGVKALGFLTRESMEAFQLQDQVAVYFPQSFNFAGNVLLYPRNQVTPIETDSSKLMAFIVSGGITES
jgi:uncharacterized membrane protein